MNDLSLDQIKQIHKVTGNRLKQIEYNHIQNITNFMQTEVNRELKHCPVQLNAFKVQHDGMGSSSSKIAFRIQIYIAGAHRNSGDYRSWTVELFFDHDKGVASHKIINFYRFGPYTDSLQERQVMKALQTIGWNDMVNKAFK